jgi:hypothetical protein
MVTILPVIRAAESKARLARRVSALAAGMAGVLDMGAQLARYRRQLVEYIAAMEPGSLEDDWATVLEDADVAKEPLEREVEIRRDEVAHAR